MNTRLLLKNTIVFLLIVVCQFGVAQSYVDVTTAQGIDVHNEGSTFGNGLSFYDFNKDGWDDLSFCTNANDPVFYVNNEGTFEEIDLGIENTFSGDIKVLQWLDYDNDGDADLFMSTSYYPVNLFENVGDLTMVDVTGDVGIEQQFVRNFGSCWGDVNNDGWLDLYVCKYHNPDLNSGYEYTNHLYLNNGDGTFTDITTSASVGDGVQASFQSVFVDYDEDGFQDIFVINDRLNMSNTLYRNKGDLTFQNLTTETGMEIYIDAMCITFGDYDKDTDLDLYMTNDVLESSGNVLFNVENEFYTDFAEAAGVLVDDICWGALWLDYNNDTELDLLVGTEGYEFPIGDQNFFFENQGDGTFQEVHNSIGLASDDYATFGLALGDHNNDGFPDFAENNFTFDSRLFETVAGDNHWFKVSLEGTLSNRDGIGSWIYLHLNGETQTRYTFCGENYLGQNSQRQMFGLGEETMIDSLEVKWLSGHVDRFYNIPGDTTWHIIEGSSQTNTIIATTDLILCIGDSAVIEGPEWDSYLWSNGDTTQTITVFEPGEYWLTGYDEMGIPVNSNTITVLGSPLLDYETNFASPLCHGDSTGAINIVNLEAAELLSFSWSHGDMELSTDSLPAGDYTLIMEDEAGCSDTISFALAEAPILVGALDLTHVSCHGLSDGSAIYTLSGGFPEYFVQWGGLDPEALAAGEYTVYAVDSVGCLIDTTFTITEPDPLELIVTTTSALEEGGGTATLEISGGTEPYSIEWSSGETDVLEVEDLGEGDFWVIVTDSNLCEIEENFFVSHIEGISDLNALIYPNPVHDELNVASLVQLCPDIQFRLTDDLGKQISLIWKSSGVLETTHLPAGVIFLSAFCDDEMLNFKLIKSQ